MNIVLGIIGIAVVSFIAYTVWDAFFGYKPHE